MHTHIQSNLQVALEVRECIIITQTSSYNSLSAHVLLDICSSIAYGTLIQRFALQEVSNAEREIHKLLGERAAR